MLITVAQIISLWNHGSPTPAVGARYTSRRLFAPLSGAKPIQSALRSFHTRNNLHLLNFKKITSNNLLLSLPFHQLKFSP